MTTLIETLRISAGEWLSADQLCEKLKLSSRALRAALDGLRLQGYQVELDPVKGCRFLGCGERLIEREITRELETKIIGRRVEIIQKCASTNDAAWQEALAGAEEGAAVFAEEQTAGRGRMGRRWIAPAHSSLLMSIVLRPNIDAQMGNLLTVMSSVAVAQALRENLRLPARIRWPNDIIVNTRKISGILVEGRSLATGAAFVLGIGLNANIPAEKFPPDLRDIATSLSIETGQSVSRIDIARMLLVSLDRWYRDLRFGDYGRIARCWRRLSSTLGERVTLIENAREYRGRVIDLSMEDGLIVRLDAGVTRIFHPSTVTLRSLT